MACGCNDLVTAGMCSEWCSAHTTEAAAIAHGESSPDASCNCAHETCRRNRSERGTPERGLS
jgi:hypothetical protein